MLNNYTFKDIATSKEKNLFAQKGLRNIRMELCVQDAIEMLNTETYQSKNRQMRMITKNGTSAILTGAMLVIAYHGDKLESPIYSSILDMMIDKNSALQYVWSQTKNFQRLVKLSLTQYGCDEIIGYQLTDGDTNSIAWMCFIEAIMHDFSVMRYADKSGRFDCEHFMRLAKAWHQYANLNLCGAVKAAIVDAAGIKSKSYFNTMMFAKINNIDLYDDDAENAMRQINQVKLQKMDDINEIRENAGKSKKYCYTDKEKDLFLEGNANAKFGIRPISLKTVVNSREYCKTIKAINTATNEIPDVAESYEDEMLAKLPDALSQLNELQMQYVQMKFYENLSDTQIKNNLNLAPKKFQKIKKSTLNTLEALLTGKEKDTINITNNDIIEGNGDVLEDII